MSYLFRFLLLFCLLLPLAEAKPPRPIEEPSIAKPVREYLARVAQAGFSGSVLVVVKGKPIILQGYGLARRDTSSAVTPDTPFYLASLTKQFTATAILRLEQEGKLSVNDTLSHFFSQVPEDKQGITLYHLLTHTSGLARKVGDGIHSMRRDDVVKALLGSPLESKPGSQYAYSNSGYALLAAVIERVTGKSYATYLQKSLFAPAGMTGTFVAGDAGKGRGQSCHVYNGDLDQGNASVPHLTYSSATIGAVGIVSTARDLYRWDRALRAHTILNATSQEKLFKPNLEGYACGWNIQRSPYGLIAWHDGMLFPEGWNGQYWHFLNEDTTVIVLSNVYRDGALSEVVGQGVKSVVVGLRTVMPPAAMGTGSLDALTGPYTGRNGERFKLSQSHGQLFIEGNDQAAVDLLTNADSFHQKIRRDGNQRTGELLRFLGSETAAIPGKDESERKRIADTLQRNHGVLVARFGPYKDGVVVNSVSEGSFTQTFARLRFRDATPVVRFYWDAGRFAGMSDMGALSGPVASVPVVPGRLPLVRQSRNTFVVCNLSSGKGIRVHLTSGKRVDISAFDLPLSAEPTKGNALFPLRGHLDAKTVTLAGSFNDWNRVTLPLTKGKAGWTCRIPLPPGKYEYKFLVNGEWMVDPDNTQTVTDSGGNTNSIITISP